MLNRNSKKLPKEDITAIKKTGKRLRNGYALTKLKRWKKEYAERKLRSTTATEEPKKTYALKTERMKRAKVTIARRKKSKAMQERREYWRKKKVSGEKKGVKGEKKAISSGRAMPTKQAIAKVKVEKKKVSGEKKGIKGEKRAISSGRATPTKQAIAKVKVEKKKVSGEKKGVKGEKRAISSVRAMPIQNRAMVNKQIVEKIKNIEKPAKVKDIKKPTIKEFAKESIEKIKEIAEETAKENLPKVKEFAKESLEKIKEIAKESAGKVIVASLPKYEENKKINKFINVTSEDLKNIYPENKLDNNNFLYVYEFLPKPIFAEKPSTKNIKPINNLNWKTFWDITANFRSREKDDKEFTKVIYSESNELVVTDKYKILLAYNTILNNETQKKLKENVAYDENMNLVQVNYPDFKKVIPDEDFADDYELNIDREIKKCELAKKLSKHFDDESYKLITKILYSDEKNYYCFSYECDNMLPILQYYKKLGIKKCLIVVQNHRNTYFSESFKINGKELKQTSKPVIIRPLSAEKYIGYSLILSNRINDLMLIDTDNKNIIVELTKSIGMSDDINMSSEVQEIANDVPAFGDLFSDIDYTNEVQEIANDVPAFGDDINEEKLILDSEYDLPEVQIKRDDTAIASSKDIRAMKFKQMMLPSKYKTLLGKVPENFRLLLWGAPGHGKSSLALTIANDIGKRIKTLYVSAEESLESATLSSRIKRFKANSRNLMFNDTNNPEIIEKIIMTFNPKFIVIDSVNVMLGKAEAMINLMLKYPNIGFIIIAQATKDRKRYAGLGSLAHAVDIVVNVKDGLATAEKNRYAQLGSMAVKGIKI